MLILLISATNPQSPNPTSKNTTSASELTATAEEATGGVVEIEVAVAEDAEEVEEEALEDVATSEVAEEVEETIEEIDQIETTGITETTVTIEIGTVIVMTVGILVVTDLILETGEIEDHQETTGKMMIEDNLSTGEITMAHEMRIEVEDDQEVAKDKAVLEVVTEATEVESQEKMAEKEESLTMTVRDQEEEVAVVKEVAMMDTEETIEVDKEEVVAREAEEQTEEITNPVLSLNQKLITATDMREVDVTSFML